MLKKDDLIKVINRSNARVSYPIPDSNGLIRLWHAKESKDVPMDELRKVMWTTGGAYILKNNLIIENKEAIKELFSVEPEPEYYYTEEEIETVKNLAVSLKLNDMSKREIIFDKTGFNVTNAININKESEKIEEVEKTERRATPIHTEEIKEEKTRRVPNYKVTSITK